MSPKGFPAEVTIYDRNEQRIAGGGAGDDTPVSLVFDAAPSTTYSVSVKATYPSFDLRGTTLTGMGPYELEIRSD